MRPVFSGLIALAALIGFTTPGAVAAEQAKPFTALGHKQILVKLDRAATNNAASVVVMVDAPGFGPPSHVHTKEDEIFYVLHGRIRIWRGEETLVAAPGESVFMPRNVPHTYQNIGQTESRLLIVVTPGHLQAFFEEAGARKLQVPRDMDEITKLCERYGITILGPPPPAPAKAKPKG